MAPHWFAPFVSLGWEVNTFRKGDKYRHHVYDPSSRLLFKCHEKSHAEHWLHCHTAGLAWEDVRRVKSRYDGPLQIPASRVVPLPCIARTDEAAVSCSSLPIGFFHVA